MSTTSEPPPPARKLSQPTKAEAIAAAFETAIKPDTEGRFAWTIASTQSLPWKPGESDDVRGREVRAQVLLFDALPPGEDTGPVGGTAARWLLVTAGPTVRDGQPDDCHGCGTIVSAFVLGRAAASGGGLVPELAAPVLALDGSFGDPPEIKVIATGPTRRALRLSSGYTGQGFTGEWQNYYAIGPGFPSLLGHPLTVHGDNDGTCSRDPAERAQNPLLQTCQTADTAVRFVPARPGETDDPGQWVLETTTINPDGLADEGVLPKGILRLPFRHGQYQLPPATS